MNGYSMMFLHLYLNCLFIAFQIYHQTVADFRYLGIAGLVDGTLRPDMARFSKKATVCKYIVPKGYGVKSLVDAEVTLDEAKIKNEGALLYYASVNEVDGKIYTTSSRSLAVVGIADTIFEAEKICESALSSIKGEVFMRHDIGTPEAVNRRIEHMDKIR